MIFIAGTCPLVCLQQAHTCLHTPLPHHTPIHACTRPSLTTPHHHGMHYALREAIMRWWCVGGQGDANRLAFTTHTCTANSLRPPVRQWKAGPGMHQHMLTKFAHDRAGH